VLGEHRDGVVDEPDVSVAPGVVGELLAGQAGDERGPKVEIRVGAESGSAENGPALGDDLPGGGVGVGRWLEVGDRSKEEQLVAGLVLGSEGHEEAGDRTEGFVGVVADLHPPEAGQELVVAIGEEVVVDGVLRGEVRVERLGLHVHGARERPQGERVESVSPHQLPGRLEDLLLGRLVAGAAAVAATGLGGDGRSHPLIVAGEGTILLTPFGKPMHERNTERRAMETAMIDAAAAAPLGHREAMGLAETEFAQMVDQLRSLSSEDWSRPTVCELWDVRAMATHVLAMAEAQASLRQFAHDFRAAQKRTGGKMIDAMTATQVRERSSLTPAAIIRRLAEVAPMAVKARRRTPAPVRWAVRMKQDSPFDAERWRLGYLVDTIFTRDTWMHHLDISRATGHPMALTAGHDGRLIGDVVGEWARRHGQTFTLTLTGPAGGTWRVGDGGEHLELDAVDFCWVVGSRQPGTGLLATEVPF